MNLRLVWRGFLEGLASLVPFRRSPDSYPYKDEYAALMRDQVQLGDDFRRVLEEASHDHIWGKRDTRN